MRKVFGSPLNLCLQIEPKVEIKKEARGDNGSKGTIP